jgi:hypothetical protein
MKGFGLEKGDLAVMVGPKGKFARLGKANAALLNLGKNKAQVVGISMGVDFDDILPGQGVRGGKKQKENLINRTPLNREGKKCRSSRLRGRVCPGEKRF